MKLETIYKLITKRYDDSAYLTSDDCIIADWHNVPEKIQDYISCRESLNGWSTGFHDDTCQCIHCYNAIRLQYDEKYLFDGEGYMCRDCMKEDPDFQQEYLEGQTFYSDSLPVYPGALTSLFKDCLQEHDFVPFHSVNSQCQDVYENGLYAGMNDSPADIAKLVTETLGPVEMVFMITDSNPFMVAFTAYVRINQN